jgi:Pentapeptide repeats (8 copies)
MIINTFLASALLVALALGEILFTWLKVLILPVVVAVATTAGAAWFTRERARDTALQGYLDKMSELLIDKKLLKEYGRYADARVTARARTLAVLSQLDGKRKRTVLLFLREARLINRHQYAREGRVIYPRAVGLRGADLSNAHLRGAQLVSTDGKEAVSLEGANLRGADLREADLRGADLSSANMRGACLRGVDLDDSGETNRPADLRGANLRKTEGLDEELLRKAIGDRTTKLPSELKAFNAWHIPVDERPCREESGPQLPLT